MAQGTLRCIGSQLRLKEKYGRGFKLSFSGQAANMGRAIGYVGYCCAMAACDDKLGFSLT